MSGLSRTALRKPAAAVLIAAGLAVLPLPVYAADFDSMTIEELRSAYAQLESENQALREENQRLKDGIVSSVIGSGGSTGGAAGSSITSSGAGTDGSAGISTGTDNSTADSGNGTATGDSAAGGTGAVTGTFRTTTQFLADIKNSYLVRQNVASEYTQSQLQQMSREDSIAFQSKCAEAERTFYNTYSNAVLDDMNIQYLCSEYAGGVGKQLTAEAQYQQDGDADAFTELYTAGYYNRAYALLELVDYYDLDLGDSVESLRQAVAAKNAEEGEETRNAGVDSNLVMQAQQLLNDLGFRCGTPDGIAGRQTTSCVVRFQSMYGFTPADGLIDQELIGEMQTILSQ